MKDLGKDLIAEKIINDLEVFCINDKYCQWKDKLELLPRHVEVCEFQDKNLQDWLQSFDKKTQNDETMVENKNLLLYYQNEHLLEKINNEIPKAPLLARLYTKDNSSKTLLTESLVPVNFESKEIFDTKDSFDILEGFFKAAEESPVLALTFQDTAKGMPIKQSLKKRFLEMAEARAPAALPEDPPPAATSWEALVGDPSAFSAKGASEANSPAPAGSTASEERIEGLATIFDFANAPREGEVSRPSIKGTSTTPVAFSSFAGT